MESLRVACAFVCVAFPATPADAEEALRSSRAIVNPLAVGELPRLDGFLGRPLFSSSRRPPAQADSKVPDVEQVESPPDFRLLGVVQMPSENIAQISEVVGSRRYSVRVGDYLGDWQVTEIERSSLTLSRGARELRLELFAKHRGRGEQNRDGPAARVSEGNWNASVPPPLIPEQRWSDDDLRSFFGDSR